MKLRCSIAPLACIAVLAGAAALPAPAAAATAALA